MGNIRGNLWGNPGGNLGCKLWKKKNLLKKFFWDSNPGQIDDFHLMRLFCLSIYIRNVTYWTTVIQKIKKIDTEFLMIIQKYRLLVWLGISTQSANLVNVLAILPATTSPPSNSADMITPRFQRDALPVIRGIPSLKLPSSTSSACFMSTTEHLHFRPVRNWKSAPPSSATNSPNLASKCMWEAQVRRRRQKLFFSRPLDSSNSRPFRRQMYLLLLFHWLRSLNKITIQQSEHVRTRVTTPCRRHSPSPYRTGGSSRSVDTSNI